MEKKDFSGCILSLLISFEDLLFNLINVYTPTDINERNIFFGGIACFFCYFLNSYKIIAGKSELQKSGENLVLLSLTR